MHRFVIPLLAPLLALVSACAAPEGEAAATSDDALRARPGYVTDSLLPMDEMLRRFRADLPAPRELSAAAASREALVRGFVSALQEQDSAGLARMHIDRAEFAWIYFPASPFASPPYELPPEYHWYQITAESNKGIGRSLRLFGVAGGEYLAHDCAERSTGEDGTNFWSECDVSWRSASGRAERYRLFGSILEHRGRFKFVSYANRL